MGAEDVLRAFSSSPSGLSEEQARDLLARMGPNEVVARPVTGFDVFLRQVRSPLTLMLVGAAAVAASLGELTDAATVAVILGINVGLGFFQEYRSASALARLRSYVGATARVRRGGVVAEIPRERIVPGDIVLLAPGDIVPGDLRLTLARGLMVDESALTGESAPRDKRTDPSLAAPAVPTDAPCMAFSGTTVVSGAGEGVAVATGNATEFGRVVALAVETRKIGAFEESVARFSLFLSKVVGVTLFAVLVANLLIEGQAARFGELLLFSLALAVSIIPEALPAVVTITFSRGALHLARKKVIVKRLSAIEDLGHIEVLCTDKTGTITENRMRVKEVFALDREEAERAAALSIVGRFDGGSQVSSFDAALFDRLDADRRVAAEKRVILARVPFDPVRRREMLVVDVPPGPGGAGASAFLVVKGAPEDVLALSATEAGQPLTAERRRAILEAFRAYGRRGLRTLAVASRPVARKGGYGEADERDLAFAGLVAFEDPLKPTAIHAIRLAERLKVRVKILTGDSAEVAGAVATAVRIVGNPKEVVTGEALAAMTPEEFAATVESADVFARVTPEQKYRIIEVLERSHAVGFLGEGINDAPALKLAQVALAVQGATDVARDAADVILLDRSLDVIIDGIREGRGIFANVAKYIRYTLSGNLGNMVSIAGISLVLPYLPMLPVQLLLVNLLSDIPLIAMATDTVEPEEIAHPRRLSIRELANFSLLMGLISTIFDFIFFGAFRLAMPAVLQTMWFVESVLQELAVIFSMRTRRPLFAGVAPSRTLVGIALVAAATTIALPFTAFGGRIFHFARPTWWMLALVLLIVTTSLVVTELVKRWYFRSRLAPADAPDGRQPS